MTPSHFGDRVFAKLNEGLEDRRGGYLRLLDPSVGAESQRVLRNLRSAWSWPEGNVEAWSGLICQRNWRPTLVACVAIHMARDTRFRDPLFSRWREGYCWVAPQLAMVLGHIHPVEARVEFQENLRHHDPGGDLKHLFSAYSVLKRIDQRSVEEFEESELFDSFRFDNPANAQQFYDGHIAADVVNSQWDFWTSPPTT